VRISDSIRALPLPAVESVDVICSEWQDKKKTTKDRS
jgi:hypothetical protein